MGYEIMANISRKIYTTINRVAVVFGKKADKFKFEQYKLKFGERHDDVYIATHPKSGTTLMQMIMYQLTTDGNMAFNHIYDVSPWIRNASYKGQKPIKLPSPRIIKTHDFYSDFPKNIKGKFIYVHRNGMDVAISLYNQKKNYNNSKLKFNKYIERNLKTKTWFKFSKAWLANKNKLNILYVQYEDLLTDKRRQINRIIEFCEIRPSEDAIERAIKYSSFEFMKEHEDKFGDQPVETKKVYDQFIRKGKSGEGENIFNDEQKELFMRYYNKLVQPLENKIFNSH